MASDFHPRYDLRKMPKIWGDSLSGVRSSNSEVRNKLKFF